MQRTTWTNVGRNCLRRRWSYPRIRSELVSTTAVTPDIDNSFLLPSIAAIVVGGTPLSGGQGGAARGLIGMPILVELTNGTLIIDLPPAVQQIVQGLVVILPFC